MTVPDPGSMRQKPRVKIDGLRDAANALVAADANADYVKRRREVPTMEPEWRLALPTGLAYDAKKSRLLVVDSQRSRLQIYNKLQRYLVPQMNL